MVWGLKYNRVKHLLKKTSRKFITLLINVIIILSLSRKKIIYHKNQRRFHNKNGTNNAKAIWVKLAN